MGAALAARLAGPPERTLLHDAVDPNAGRAPLLRRIESRTQFHHRRTVGAAHA